MPQADGARAAHEMLLRKLEEVTLADQNARQARRVADQRVADAARALSRAEADRNLAEGKLETLGIAVSRHEEEDAERRPAAERGGKGPGRIWAIWIRPAARSRISSSRSRRRGSPC